LFSDAPRLERPPVSEKSPGLPVVPGEADVAPAAAVPDALLAPLLSAANAQPEVIAIVVAKRTVEIFMSWVSKLLVGG
jgi:hypothetical protein